MPALAGKLVHPAAPIGEPIHAAARVRAFLPRGGLYMVRRHREHIFTRVGFPSIASVCLWTLAFHRVLVLRLEWLTLLPYIPAFPHIWHCMVIFLRCWWRHYSTTLPH